jgi:dolichol-phosphate mannosyltransferase
VPSLLAEWRAGAHVVWAARRRREGERAGRLAFSRLYYWVMRHVVGLRGLPATGADFFLADRAVVEALRQFGETHVSVLALITWMGFRQTTIDYDKQPRAHGVSGWSLEKKLKLLIDSVTAFSYLPIRAISWTGGLLLLVSLIAGALGAVGVLAGRPPGGWAAVLVALLALGGLQMLALGVLGEYLWRALDESRRRPRYLIESTTGGREPGPPASP